MNKIYTFQYQFKSNSGFDSYNGYDEIQKCAYNLEEANELFWDFIHSEGYKVKDIDILDVSVVYNEDDDLEYGVDYGTPEDYAEKYGSSEHI